MTFPSMEQMLAKMKTNLGGKLSFSAELGGDKAVYVEIKKC